MLRTSLCDLLGIELPIISAPMGPDISGQELVAAVSGAGGLGTMQAQFHPPHLLREAMHRVRSLTDKPFGVGFVLHFPCEEGVAICIEERVPILWTFWGDPAPIVGPAHAAGVKVFAQVGSVSGARAAVAAGVHVVVAEGVEAGGHVAGEVSTLTLAPRVVDAVRPVPVVASGGIADGRGLVAALALGAGAAALGTRFLATNEANAHALYKARVLAASEGDTVLTILFGRGWPYARTAHCAPPLSRNGSDERNRARRSAPTSRSSDTHGSLARRCRSSVSSASPRTGTPPARSSRWTCWRARASGL
jgi:nitronate monooxygenase